MPRLSSYFIAFVFLTSAVWADEGADWKKYRLQGVSEAYYCPEQVGEPKWECGNKYCGGENPNKKGHCSLVILQGKSDVINQALLNPPLYCECGPKDGDSGGKVPPIIPFPPPPPGFVPPPAGIPHPKKQDSCPEDFTDTQCMDCKPVSGWCTEGPQAGCPCKEECPAENSKDTPSCSDDSCEGENGKCSTGHYADCKCKDTCPDPKKEYIDCASEDCKSDDHEICKEGEFRGCKCLVVDSDIFSETRSKLSEGLNALDQLQQIYDHINDYISEPETKCSSSSNTKAVAIDKQAAYTMGENFCAHLDYSKEAKKDMTSKDIGSSSYKDFVFHFEYKPGNKCYTNCKDTIHKMVCSGYDSHSIQPESKATFKCGAEYTFKFSVPDHAQFPTATSKPTSPANTAAPTMGEVTCFPESRRPGSIYGGVRPDQYTAAVDKACEAFAKKSTLQANEGRGSYVYQTKDGPVPYWFNVGVNTDGHYTCKDLKLEDPIGDGSHKCSTIFKDDIFGGCNNGGRGGRIKVGCLVYSFDVCSGKGDIPNEGACSGGGIGAPEVAF